MQDHVKQALATLSDYVERSTHWREGGATRHDARLALNVLEQPPVLTPIDMILHCPHCHMQHIDAPESHEVDECPATGQGCHIEEGACKFCGSPPHWTNPPHTSHLCGYCGWQWRPADVPTNGVRSTLTRHTKDSEPPPVDPRRFVPGHRSGKSIVPAMMAARVLQLTPAEAEAVAKDPGGLACLMRYHDVCDAEQSAFDGETLTSYHRLRRQHLYERGRSIMAEDLEIWSRDLLQDFGFPVEAEVIWIAGVAQDFGCNKPWEILGAFTSKAAAIGACTKPTHFVGSLRINERLPDTLHTWVDAFFPATNRPLQE